MSGAVIRNALQEQSAELVRKLFINSDWSHVPFKDPGYYSGYPDRTSRGFPSTAETYSTDFWSCDALTQEPMVIQCVDIIADVIDSILIDGAKVDRKTIDLLAYRLRPGGHLRLHDDAYTADVGFIWYLSKNWRWDWGGLLLSFHDDGPPSVEMPEFNKLVIINHSRGVTHCVTGVEQWAQDDRYMLVGMMRRAQ